MLFQQSTAMYSRTPPFLFSPAFFFFFFLPFFGSFFADHVHSLQSPNTIKWQPSLKFIQSYKSLWGFQYSLFPHFEEIFLDSCSVAKPIAANLHQLLKHWEICHVTFSITIVFQISTFFRKPVRFD